MIKSILTSLLLGFALCAIAQVNVEGVDVNTADVYYVQIVGTEQFLSNKVTIQVDYGQKLKYGQGQRISGPDGKAQIFNGMIDALNFMERNGWEYINNYTITLNNQNVYHYLLRRKPE